MTGLFFRVMCFSPEGENPGDLSGEILVTGRTVPRIAQHPHTYTIRLHIIGYNIIRYSIIPYDTVKHH